MGSSSARAIDTLVGGFFDLYPIEAARLLEDSPVEETAQLLQRRSLSHSISVMEKMTPDSAVQVLEQLDDSTATRLLTGLDPAQSAVLLARMEETVRGRRLDQLSGDRAKELRTLLSYPPDMAGRLMDPQVTTLRTDATVAEALGRLRGLGARQIHDLFLVDPQGQLAGAVALRSLVVADPSQRLEEIAQRDPVRIRATANREEVVEEFERYGLTSLPVVDFEGRLLGVIRSDALMAAAKEEASADMQSMVGASREERALSKISFAVRKRLPWLEVNLGTAFLAAAVVGLFEDTIARFTALAVLLPVVAGQSGNTGAQALAVTMRGLALREIRIRHWLQVTWKEVSVGFLNGCVVALTTSFAVYVWSRSTGLALVIGLSMILSMVAAGLAGASIPMILTALGQDPAQSSSIILTTVTDVVGFLSFLGIATLLAAML